MKSLTLDINLEIKLFFRLMRENYLIFVLYPVSDEGQSRIKQQQ